MTAVAGTFGDLPGNDKMPPTTVGPGTVTEIIDGQTFKVDINGDTHTVRLIGIAAPREGDCYHNEATERLALLLPVGTTNTVLERDTTDVDNDGALLRYATNRIARPLKAVQDHAESMVHGGFARVNPQSPDTSLAEVYQDAEHLAYANDRGLWANC
jgi:endonuclease YncB( thermonuclease family)